MARKCFYNAGKRKNKMAALNCKNKMEDMRMD